MKVGELRPGMVLAQAVRDVNGRLLMAVGTCLTERFIGVLKAWGICEVAVEGEPGQGGASDLPEELARQAEDIVAARFSLNDIEHPFVQDAFRLAMSRTADLIAHGVAVDRPRVETARTLPDDPLDPLDLDSLTGSDPSLGAMPEVLAQLAQAMENPGASPVEVAAIIQNDPGLAAKLLKVVNSALYGSAQRIDTISRAVTVIGVQQLSALALGFSVLGLLRDIPRELLDIRNFWRHCLACACGARALASAIGLANTERYFVAGLLHDVGFLLFILHAPRHVRQVMASVRDNGEPLTAAERRILGADHGTAGASLLSSWKLPESLTLAAGHHHDPLCAPDARDVAIVHAADFLAEALLMGSIGQSVVMPLDQAAYSLLDAPSGVADMVYERLEDQLGQLETIFLGHVGA